MIRSFRHKGLRRFHETGSRSGIQPAHAARLRRLLARLDAASLVSDMAFPGSDLHPLRAEWEGRWAVDVNGPWRVTFRFEGGHAWEVDDVQYH